MHCSNDFISINSSTLTALLVNQLLLLSPCVDGELGFWSNNLLKTREKWSPFSWSSSNVCTLEYFLVGLLS